jgi:hypothetical protein
VAPAVIVPNIKNTIFTLGAGFLISTDFHLGLLKNYHIDPSILSESGPVFSVAAKHFSENSDRKGLLSWGVTLSALYRFSAISDLSFLDLLQGKSYGPRNNGQERAWIDLHPGLHYLWPKLTPLAKFSTSLSISNLLSSAYSGIRLPIQNVGDSPSRPPRTVHFGLGAEFQPFWKFGKSLLAVEWLEMGQGGGSFWTHLHLGGEMNWRWLSWRMGIHQGYGTLGLGARWKTKNLAGRIDLAYFSEERGLSPGDFQDRQIALNLGLAWTSSTSQALQFEP